MADVQIVTVALSDGTQVQVVAGTPLHELYLALAGFTTTAGAASPDIDLTTLRPMAWFMTPFGPQSVVEPATITEFRRRDYLELTAQQAADFFANAVEIPDVSFITGQELPAAMAAAAGDDDSPFAVGLRAAFERVVNPVAFGAVGDGTTDDAAAWQSALDEALEGPIRLRPTPGSYLLRNVQIHSDTVLDLDGVTLVYGGTNGTIGPVESVPTILYTAAAAPAWVDNVTIVGGTFIGGRPEGNWTDVSEPTSDDTVYFWRTRNATVVGSTFRDSGQDAVTFDDCLNGIVRDCRFSDIGDASVDLRSGHTYQVTGCWFDTVHNMVAAKPNINNVTVSGNSGSTFGPGITAHGDNWQILNNTITAVATDDGQNGAAYNGIRILAEGPVTPPVATSGYTITGNTITGRTTGHSAIQLVGTNPQPISDILVEGNRVSTCRRGVAVETGTRVQVRGNSLSVTETGVLMNVVAATAQVTVAGNTITSGGRAVDTAAADTLIQNNRCITAASDAIYLSSAATGSNVQGNRVTSAGIGVTAFAAGSSVANNVIVTSAGEAISLAGANSAAVGNRLTPAAEGVKIAAAGCAVTGNVCTGGTHGIRVSASDCVVSGNRVTGAQFFGVNISSGAVDTVVTGNSLKGNTSGGINDAGTTSLLGNNKP